MSAIQTQERRVAAKRVVSPLRAALRNADRAAAQAAISTVFARDARLRLAFPFEELDGPDALFGSALGPLSDALHGLERRDAIVMAGSTDDDQTWVGCCGQYVGAFVQPFLDIPPTGHFATMRYHEFYRVEDDRVVEFQGLWDIPELMHQAGAWPMTPQLGRNWYAPGPATQDGLAIANRDDAHADASLKLVRDMCADLGAYAEGGVEAMRLDRYWHPHCSWYGPYGIGTCRGIDGFRNWHQIPFLNGMPDRAGTGGYGAFFADGDFVGVTGWPNMEATISDNGWLGIAPAGQKITMRSLDFWRCEDGLIRENWVLVDLLSVYDQIGVDVFARMREFNKATAPRNAF
ncbi:MAG: ester cyclase [Pseudomonadota bacterium]